MSTRTGVRVAIVGIFAALGTIVSVADVRSQPGRPGGIAGRPGGVTGMPGGVTGITGISGRPPGGITGITGISGISGLGGPPAGFSGGPGGISGLPGPGGFGGSRYETVWTCGKCKAELGRGNVKPSVDSCPQCGVRFINGGGGGAGGFGLVNPPPPVDFGGGFNGGAPGFPPPAGGTPRVTPPTGGAPDPDLMPRGAGGTSSAPSSSPPPTNNSGSANAGPSDNSSTTPSEPTSKTGSLILKIMIGVFGLLFVIGIVGGAILIISANKGSKPAKRSRKKALDLDDDD